MNTHSKEQAKAKARALQRFLATEGTSLKFRKALDAIAVIEGLPNWNTLAARLPDASAASAAATPQNVAADGTTELHQSIATSVLLSNASDIAIEQELRASLRNPEGMTERVFRALTDLDCGMEVDISQGRDCVEGFEERHAELSRLLDASSWTLHPDYGCVRREQVEELDRQADSAKVSPEAETLPGASWFASLVRIGFGSIELTVEASSLQEALSLGEHLASDRFIPEDNYSWGVTYLRCGEQVAPVPKWAAMPEAEPIDHISTKQVNGKARYSLSITREGIAHSEWRGSAPSLESACMSALDDAVTHDVSESASNYLLDVLYVEALVA